MDFNQYIRNVKKPIDFQPTGMNKEFYLDIIELALGSYPKEELEERTKQYEAGRADDIQAFSRLTSAIAVLLSLGRKMDYMELWERMMGVCCRDISLITEGAMPDFAVKELMLAYKAMKAHIPEEKRALWLSGLRSVEPSRNYACTLEKNERLHNINIYNMAGEYLRETEGLTRTEEYFNRHWPIQLNNFDENGMYIDPGAPILYDLATRVQIQYILGAGYTGKYAKPLDAMLKSAGLMTLFMQSSAFVLPYGGRSNQFQFNEAFIAANAEYEAVRYKKMGDLVTAGMFKRCAHLAACSVRRWIDQVDIPRHIKNFFPIESKFGTEEYAYYDKYMISLGCFIYPAYLYADDSIEEYPCPAEVGGYVLESSKDFHKIFANCGGNSIEIDTKADFHYDSTGLGRYHKRDIPVELALSLPLAKDANYFLPEGLKKRNLSICPGWETKEGAIQFLSELSDGLEHTLDVQCSTQEKVAFTVTYRGDKINGCKAIKEAYTISASEVRIEATLEDALHDRIYYTIPLFHTNERDYSEISLENGEAEVVLGKSSFHVKTSGSINFEDSSFGNRNGIYKLLCIKGEAKHLSISLILENY